MNKQYKPCKGSHTLGKVIPGLGINLKDIIFHDAPIPSDTVEPVFNDMTELSEVGEVCRDKFDLLAKVGVQSQVFSSGMGSSQPTVVES